MQFEETFFFVLGPDQLPVIDDSVVIQFNNFKTIGSPDPMYECNLRPINHLGVKR